jgi:hypothetical protein
VPERPVYHSGEDPLVEYLIASRESLKWILRITMAWALCVAAGKVSELTPLWGASVGLDPSSSVRATHQWAAFGIFVPALYRFYFGDSQYFAHRVSRLKAMAEWLRAVRSQIYTKESAHQ